MYEEYLEKNKYIDYDNESVYNLALDLKDKSSDKKDLIKNTYYYVRDNIKHSWDAQDRRVTISASDC